jgi:DNA modification methylase
VTGDPYYSDEFVTLYHGDCREITAWLDADVLVTDPPYGIGYRSGAMRVDGSARSIEGDDDTSTRDNALTMWGERPAIVFGTWKRPRPAATHTRLIWDTKGALGMGDLSVPWKPSDQEIYVIGRGFHGHRGSNVLTFAPEQATGRLHPHQKPVELLEELIGKCPPGVVADPFAGSGSTLVAAKRAGRRAIGVEVDEGYCRVAAERLGAFIPTADSLFGALT